MTKDELKSKVRKILGAGAEKTEKPEVDVIEILADIIYLVRGKYGENAEPTLEDLNALIAPYPMAEHSIIFLASTTPPLVNAIIAEWKREGHKLEEIINREDVLAMLPKLGFWLSETGDNILSYMENLKTGITPEGRSLQQDKEVVGCLSYLKSGIHPEVEE